MKTFKKQISVLLAVMMILCSFTALSFSASAAATKKGTITIASNLCNSVSYNYTDSDKQLKVTYYLQSANKIIDLQAGLTYDNKVLKVASTNTQETCLPKLLDGNTVINFKRENKVLFNSNSLYLYDFTTKGVFFTVTFDIIGSGNTNVNLNVDVITATTAKSYDDIANGQDIDLVYYGDIMKNDFSFSAEGKIIGEPVNTDEYSITSDSFNLKLSSCGTNKVNGVISLQPGTYSFKINKSGKLLGYGKTFTNTTSGLTFKSTYNSSCTLKATGGTYTFQLNTDTDTLVVKYNSTLAKEYLIGDLHTILTPVPGKTLSVGSSYLEAGSYTFRLSIGNVEYGYSKVINDTTVGSLSFNSKYKSSCTLIATGGTYTFTLNTATNRLQVGFAPSKDEANDDVHVSGDINFVLNDNGGESNIATGSIKLDEGTYSFKIYNYGVAYTLGERFIDKGTKVLKSSYKSNVTLVASGGTYKFSFNKTTGALTIEKA